MKKMLPAALLALVACGLSATSSFAGAFGLIPHGCCWGCCCGCNVCVRPYNAFSPVVSGCLCADGCVPFSAGGPGYGGPDGPGCGPWGCGGDGGCVDGGYGSLPPGAVISDGPSPGGKAQPKTSGSGSPSSAVPAPNPISALPQAQLHTAGYRPAYPVNAFYSPAVPQPMMMNVPSYWNDR
jgi:hypothetical protein